MVVKTGVALPDNIYKQLIEISKNMGYTSISRVIRDAVELFIAFNQWWTHNGTVGGALHLLVPENNDTIATLVQKILREYSDIITSSIVVRPTQGYILYTMLVHGAGKKVKELYRLLAKTRGILGLQASLFPIPKTQT